MDRRYSKLLVLAVAALLAEACSSSPSKTGTGGAGGGSSSTGGATGSGGATGTGGKAGASGAGGGSQGGMTGTGGKTDGGTDTTSSGGMTGTDAADAPKDMSVSTDVPADTGSADADPAQPEKALCMMTAYQNTSTPVFSATQFCTLYFSICNDLSGVQQFANEAACEAAYNGYNTDPDAGGSIANEGPNGQKGCRTYHLCNAVRLGVMPHCAHATGLTGFDGGNGSPCP